MISMRSGQHACWDRPARQDTRLQGTGLFQQKRAQWELKPWEKSKYNLKAGSVPGLGMVGVGRDRAVKQQTEC